MPLPRISKGLWKFVSKRNKAAIIVIMRIRFRLKMSTETIVNCNSFRACDAQTPCGEGTDCCDNPNINAEPICLPPALCNLNQACEATAECGGLDCCAIPGTEMPRCVEECPDEWRR